MFVEKQWNTIAPTPAGSNIAASDGGFVAQPRWGRLWGGHLCSTNVSPPSERQGRAGLWGEDTDSCLSMSLVMENHAHL